jgi:biotin operon repressor
LTKELISFQEVKVMSFSLHISNLSPEQIIFAYSPAHEAMVALHVFVDPKHHPLHIAWMIQARRRMSPSLKAEIDGFRFLYSRPIVEFWEINEESSIRSFSDALNELKDKPIRLYIKSVMETFLGQKIEDDKLPHAQKAFLEMANERFPDCKDVILDLMEHPKENRDRFLSMLEAFWDTCLKKDWPEMESKFLEDITSRGNTLLTKGPLCLLKSLSPEIEIDPKEKKAVLRRVSKGDFHFEEKDSLCLAPTYFAWPHLFVRSEKPIGLNYPIMEKQREAKPPFPPEDLIKFFRAMGDLTRFQIMTYLSEQPRSTRELAELIGITEGAVSKHLKKLEDVGIIFPKRESYYVFYVLNKEFIGVFQKSLSSLF